MTIKWKPEEVKMLEQMAHAGMSIPDMLRVFKSRTTNGIRNKMADMGIVSSYLSPEVDEAEFKRLMKGR